MVRNIRPLSVFISYAREDEVWLIKLEKHLSPLKKQGLISTWYNQMIVAGTDWAKVIDQRLEEASIILLIVSADFIASDYCYGVELKRALERHNTEDVRVIPIAIRPADWRGVSFANLHPLPTDSNAVSTWEDEDKAFVDVVTGIRKAIEDLSLAATDTLSPSFTEKASSSPTQLKRGGSAQWAVPPSFRNHWLQLLFATLVLCLVLYIIGIMAIHNLLHSDKTLLPNIIPSSTSTVPSPTVIQQSTPSHSFIYLKFPPTPLTIPCNSKCVSKFDVVLEKVVFDNFHNDLLITFKITSKEVNICSDIVVNVLRLGSGNNRAKTDGVQGQISSIAPLGAGLMTMSAYFSLMPLTTISYHLTLVLSCQVDTPMFYQQTLSFMSLGTYGLSPNPPVVVFIRSLSGILIALLVLISASIWWLAQPNPFGVLISSIPKVTTRRKGKEEKETCLIILGAKRSLACKLLSKSMISSKELEKKSLKAEFDLDKGVFDIIFKKGKKVSIRARRYAPLISLQRYEENAIINIPCHKEKIIHLRDGDIININRKDVAIFRISLNESQN